MGSRFGSLKQMQPLGPHQKSLLHYTVYDAVHAGFAKIVFVIRESFAAEFKEFIGKYSESLAETVYCYQDINKLPAGLPAVEREKPWGTAHAVWSARKVINEPFAVLNADDFYGGDAFQKAYDFLAHSGDDNEYCLIGYRLGATLSENGTVSRGVCQVDNAGYLTDVKEFTKIKMQADAEIIDEATDTLLHTDDMVSMNFWGFKSGIFNEIEKSFVDFYSKNSNNPKSEFYIPTVVDGMIKKSIVKVKAIPTAAKWFGVTYKEDTEIVNKALTEFERNGFYKDL